MNGFEIGDRLYAKYGITMKQFELSDALYGNHKE
jgi:hypothetical protein